MTTPTDRARLELALAEAGERHDQAVTAERQAMAEIGELANQTHAAGTPIARIAELARVTRPTIYSILSPPEKPRRH